jgi:hypothetical protein
VGYNHGWWIDPDDSMVAVGFAGQSLCINHHHIVSDGTSPSGSGQT